MVFSRALLLSIEKFLKDKFNLLLFSSAFLEKRKPNWKNK